MGGTHYRARYQHWDLVEDNDIDYLPATASKYIDRWRYKGKPLEDLQKARSYLLKMNGRAVRRHADMEDLSRWLRERNHETHDADLLVAILSPERGTACDIRHVVHELDEMIDRVASNEGRPVEKG